MTRSLWAFALLAACTGDKSTDGSTTGDTGTTTTSTFPGVMRDCPETAGTICPYAGAGYNGWNGDEVHRLDAWFSFPMSIAFPKGSGDPVVADWNNHKLRVIESDPAAGMKTIMGTDFLGDGDPELKDRTPDGALGTTVNLNHPTQQMFFSDGTLLSDSWHTHKLRTWDPATGMVHVYLGSRPGMAVDEYGAPVEFGQDAATTLLNQPKEIWIDQNDENFVYILDMRNERIRVLDRAAWTVDTVAGETVDVSGDGLPGSKGYCGEGDALQTCFGFPKNANPEPGGGIAMNADSSLMYIADSENHVIRVLDIAAGTISLLSGTPGTSGFQDGDAASALWYYPSDFAIDDANNVLYVADTNNHRVRAIDLDTNTVSTVAGVGHPSCDVVNLLDPAFCDEQHTAGDGGPATEATLYRPFGVDLSPDGKLIISDTYNHRLRIIH